MIDKLTKPAFLIWRKSLFLFHLALLCGLLNTLCDAQQLNTNSVLDQKVTMRLRNYSVEDALRTLSIRAGVPIGFIADLEGNDTSKNMTFYVKEKPIREILDEIVRLNDRYRWEITNEVINVLPVTLNNTVPDLRITCLQLSEIELSKVGPAILDTPEIRAELEKIGKKKTEGFKYAGPPIKKSNVSIVLLNTTIRAGLNELLNRKLARFWTLETSGVQNEFVQIILFDWFDAGDNVKKGENMPQTNQESGLIISLGLPGGLVVEKDQAFRAMMPIRNNSDKEFNLAVSSSFRLQAKNNGTVFFGPVYLRNYLEDSPKSAILPPGGEVQITIDLTKLEWGKANSSVWPSQRIFEVLECGDYDLHFQISLPNGRTQDGKYPLTKTIKSNILVVSVPGSQ